MSAFATVGSFVPRAGIGIQSITGVGFRPKGLLIWGETDPIVASGFGPFRYSLIGMTDGTTQWGYSAAENRPVSPSDVNTSGTNIQFIFGKSFNNSSEMIAGFASFDADGFTIDWSFNAFGAATSYFYLAFGGTDVNCKVFSGNSTGLGNQSITGIGFKPTILLGFCGMDGGVDQSTQQFGWSNGSVDGSILLNSKNASNPSNTIALQRDSVYTSVDYSTNTIKTVGTVLSFDSDGLTINWSVHTAVCPFQGMAINGLTAVVGKTTQPTSTGIQDITTSLTSQLVAMLQGVCHTASAAVQTDLRQFRGGVNSSGGQVCAFTASINGQATSESGRCHRNNVTIVHGHAVPAAAVPVLDAEATASLIANKIRLNWTTVDPTAREFLYLSIAALINPPTTSAGPDQEIYTTTTVLAGSVTGDGSPTALWTKISGVGDVTFDDSTNPTTNVSFSHRGTYVLRLTGTNAAGSTSDDVTISFVGIVVSAGDDQTVTLTDGAILNGSYLVVAG